MSAPPAPRSTSAPSSGLVVGGYLCALFVRSSASSSPRRDQARRQRDQPRPVDRPVALASFAVSVLILAGSSA